MNKAYKLIHLIFKCCKPKYFLFWIRLLGLSSLDQSSGNLTVRNYTNMLYVCTEENNLNLSLINPQLWMGKAPCWKWWRHLIDKYPNHLEQALMTISTEPFEMTLIAYKWMSHYQWVWPWCTNNPIIFSNCVFIYIKAKPLNKIGF